MCRIQLKLKLSLILAQALQVLENLVLTGSERVVQEAMDHKRSLGILVRYNSALSGYHGYCNYASHIFSQ